MVESTTPQAKVVITGITGYLGSHVCNVFLKDGGFQVRGTVRDKKNARKIAPIRQAFGENFEKLELYEADLLKPESLESAIEGMTYVVHTASPFPLESPKDENELIRPAVQGTLAVMRAAHKHKVKRVLITSSIAAIYGQKPENQKQVYTEDDWTDINTVGAYEKSKTLAERAAWDYLLSIPESERFELVIINPVLILGPSLVPGDFTSGAIIRKLMSGVYPGIAKIQLTFVDVRECALAHLQGIKVPEAKNQRFILSSNSLWLKEIAMTLNGAFPQLRIRTFDVPYLPAKIVSYFDKPIKQILPMWGKTMIIDNKRSQNVLGIQYRTSEESVIAMAQYFMENRKLAKL